MTATVKLLGPVQVNRACQLIREAPQGHVMTLREPTRNLDQNAMMWVLIEDVRRANVEGYLPATKEVWKCRFMHALDHEIDFDIGLDGKPYPLGTSSSKLSVRQMADLITFIEAWGAQHGVPFSDPKGADA